MPGWILVALGAAFVQNLRFMLQRQLRLGALSTLGATWARFAFAWPLAGLLLAALAVAGRPVPGPTAAFAAWAALGGLAQILATALVVALFTRRNFAVGVTFKKTEVLQTALVAWLVAGEGIGAGALAAIALGFAGVVLLSPPPAGRSAPPLEVVWRWGWARARSSPSRPWPTAARRWRSPARPAPSSARR